MKTLVLLCAFPAAAAPACEKTEIVPLGQAQARIIACYQAADKAPAKQPAPTAPAQPAKKQPPKDRGSRLNPPGHLFM